MDPRIEKLANIKKQLEDYYKKVSQAQRDYNELKNKIVNMPTIDPQYQQSAQKIYQIEGSLCMFHNHISNLWKENIKLEFGQVGGNLEKALINTDEPSINVPRFPSNNGGQTPSNPFSGMPDMQTISKIVGLLQSGKIPMKLIGQMMGGKTPDMNQLMELVAQFTGNGQPSQPQPQTEPEQQTDSGNNGSSSSMYGVHPVPKQASSPIEPTELIPPGSGERGVVGEVSPPPPIIEGSENG